MSTPPDRAESQRPTARLALNIGLAVTCKFILNTTRRFVYPFAPVLSRGLGVPLTAITSLIALNWAAGIMAIFLGPVADRFGYRFIMIIGMVLLAVGLLVSGLVPLYAVVLVALFLAALGKAVFDPAVQAYVSEHVPYRRRGLVIGILEYSWAGSALLGIPALAIIIDRFGWRSPFFVMGLLAVLGIAVMLLLIPPGTKNHTGSKSGIYITAAWKEVVRNRSARGALAFIFLVSAANDALFVVYGAWLEDTFGLSIVALGLGTSTIGLAELLGETMTAALADRIGLKRSVISGLTICIIFYIIMPVVSQTIPMAFTSLFLIFVTFEFVVVTSVSMATELLPQARATMMATYMAAAGLGRAAGALIGGPVWLLGGIIAIGITAALISTMALAALWWGLREGKEPKGILG